VRRLIALVSSTAAGVLFALQSFDSHQYYFFTRMIVIDPFASVMKAVVSLGFAVTLVDSRRYLEDRELFRDDVFLLGRFSLRGQLIMIVRHPHMERHGPHLERHAGHNEGHAKQKHDIIDVPRGDRLQDLAKFERAGGAEEHRYAVQQETRR
jgi:hypothetical protein